MAEYTDILYDITHAPFDERVNSAESFNSILVVPMFSEYAAIQRAKEEWEERKGEVHVIRETWEDDYLAKKETIFVKTNDGTEYDEARIKKSRGLDSVGYMGYEIRNNKGHYEVWQGGKLVSSADTYSEAAKDIDEMLESKGEPKPELPKPKPEQKPKKDMHLYRVWYVDYASDQSMSEDIMAYSPDDARRRVKAKFGRSIYGYPHDVYLLDAEGGSKMSEEEYESLCRAAGKKADVLFDFYDMSQESGDLFEETYKALGLPIDEEWAIHPDVLEDSGKLDSLFNAVRKAIIDRANKKQLHSLLSPKDQRYSADEAEDRLLKAFNIRVVYDSAKPLEEVEVELDGELDKLVEEAYHEYCKCIEQNKEGEFKFSEKLEELLNKLGEFTSSTSTELLGMFKEMAECEGVKGKPRKLDSAQSKAAIEKRVKRILSKWLKSRGYEDSDVDDYVVVDIREKKDEDGEPYVHVQIRNDLVGWYKLPEEVQDQINKVFEPYGGYIEPYDSTTWDGYMWGVKLADAKPEDEGDSLKLQKLLSELQGIIKADGFSGANYGFSVSHEKEGDKDFIVFKGKREFQGSDEEGDTATNLDEAIKKSWPNAELASWNKEEAGCRWELK